MRVIPTAGGHLEVVSPVISLDPPQLGAGPPIPSPGGRTHLVLPGETLQSIARARYGSPAAWTRLAAANSHQLGPDNRTRAGQVLSVPY